MKRIIKGSILALFFAGFFSCSGGRATCESYGNARYEKYKTMHVKKKDAKFSYKKKRYNLEFQENGG
jgi:hypothetical protein